MPMATIDENEATLADVHRLTVAYATRFDIELIDPRTLKAALRDATAAKNAMATIEALLAGRLADTETGGAKGSTPPPNKSPP